MTASIALQAEKRHYRKVRGQPPLRPLLAILALELSMPVAAPPVPGTRAVVAGLVRTLARLRTLPFIE